MGETNNRILPVGIQSFEKIRKEGLLYVDKTEIIWNLVNSNKTYNYLSRPRRFGKSLLVDTLQAYFEGRKELFEGLKIMDLEKEWVKRPVIRLDMSQAAIIIDEYDSPLQHSWKTPHHEDCTSIYRSVFAILKADDAYEKFVFITGITKFTQISLFSVLNNLSNISFDPPYAAICGITKEEVANNFMPEIEVMGEHNGWTPEETILQLKAYYDGYHFCKNSPVDIFNPFSLLNTLADKELKNYWAASGATSLLPKFVSDMEIQLEHFDHCYIDRDTLETSDVSDGGTELFLYQSGYLTIKDYDEGVYTLGIPNFEVRKALYKIVVPALTLKTKAQAITTQNILLKMMQDGNLDEAKKALKALIADVPYSNKKLASMDMEERYRLIISTIFNAIGFKVEVEKQISTGRIDMVVFTRRIIYVFKLKLTNNGGVKAAEHQIKDRQYVEPFKADGRKVIALAVELDDMGKGLIDWKEVN